MFAAVETRNSVKHILQWGGAGVSLHEITQRFVKNTANAKCTMHKVPQVAGGMWKNRLPSNTASLLMSEEGERHKDDLHVIVYRKHVGVKLHCTELFSA